MHANKIDGKKYIGITHHGDNPNERWKNGLAYNKNTYIRRAVEKYGWNNFDHEILANNLTKSEAELLEQEYIQKYNTRSPDGYNMTIGGEGFTGMTGELNPMFGVSPQERMDKETFESWRSQIGEWARGFCDNMSKEQYEAICESRKGGKHNLAIITYCHELNKVYSYAKQAMIELNLSEHVVRESLKSQNHKVKTSPYHFYPVYDYTKRNGEVIPGAITLGLITEADALAQLETSS